MIFVLVGFLSLFRISIETQLFLYLILFLIIKITRSNLYILTTFGWAIFFCLGIVFKKNIKLIFPNMYVLAIIVMLIGWYASLAVIYLSNHFKTINFIFNAYNGIINLKNK